MKLTIGNRPVALPADATITLEKSSPLLNEDTGSFSYPFPVPTKPNQSLLGWPGRLERAGNLPECSFILEDGGLQVMRGEVEYDEVTASQIGVVLKSGMTEFFARVEGKKLSQMNLGSEYLWPELTSWAVIHEKLSQWDGYNAAENSGIIAAPCLMNGQDVAGQISTLRPRINEHFGGMIGLASGYQEGYGASEGGYIMLQFKLWWVLERIFESYGYTIAQNELKTGIFKDAILFSRPFFVLCYDLDLYSVKTAPNGDLAYASLMPELDVIQFINAAKSLFRLITDIDERKKEVRITFAKNIFLPENLDRMKISELAGWVHKERKSVNGFTLQFQQQDDELDTKSDYQITGTVTDVLPAPAVEGEVYRLSSLQRDYIVSKKESEGLEWRQIGRLKAVVEGNGDDKTEIAVKIPKQVTLSGTEVPKLEINAISDLSNGRLVPLSELIVSLYRGRQTFNSLTVPFICFDRYSIASAGLPYPPIQYSTSLLPSDLYRDVYSEYLNWHASTREFTKYIQLTLPELLRLQWGKRYLIGGIQVILDKINYEIPHKETVKVTGFTV